MRDSSGVAAIAERVWYGTDVDARLARAALAPLSLLYGSAVRLRGVLYDRRVLRARRLAIPAVSVGNLSVGGTGKTPVAAWLACELRTRGERPSVVLRGYGGDEALVHARLNPDVIVVVDPDRVRGVRTAAERGATVAVLDDAFQHRRAQREADVVLVSADRWAPGGRLLPAGPLREPIAALGRATAVIVTRKVAAADATRATLALVVRHAPHAAVAVVHLAPVAVRSWEHADRGRGLESLRGERVLAFSAVADPAAFETQLAALGADVEVRRFRDHHAFTVDDADSLARAADGSGRVALCTLKDAVKLGPLWPRAAQPLWYLVQRVIVERGADELANSISAALRSRHP